ncbi:MAG: DUF3142 domain-containing protein [Phyllobacteriaceae bacterium]|nr:DUF3142 domain-containing protein [Phyllobacteriaceae bacterium]
MATRSGPRTCAIIGSALALWFAAGSALADPVKVEDYSAFWLWAGVKPQPVLKTAKEIYLLAGEVRGDIHPHIISQRSATPKLANTRLWVVYRAQTILWDERVLANILKQMNAWQAAGNTVVGLQIDFDAGTKHLDRYASFLAGLRADLPLHYKLGVTGLLDWSANGDPAGLDAIAGVVDEVVLQIYQGRRVIPGYESYLARLDKMRMPFRIGLLQNGDWHAPSSLLQNPWFNGYVVFLLNDQT